MNTSNVQGIFAGMVIFIVICIFGLYVFLPSDYVSISVFVFVLVACIAFTIGLKAIVLENDRSLNEKDVGDIVLNASIAVLSIVGTMLAFISQRPLIGRAFENTVGYKWIEMFSGLTEVMNSVFQGSPGYDYNILATQLFDDQLTDNQKTVEQLNAVAAMFNGVTVNSGANLEQLQAVITKKRIISEATLTSLATIIAFYISYLPVWKPWIRG